MKYYMIQLFDKVLARVGLVRKVFYDGQEGWVTFLESILSKGFANKIVEVVPPAKPTRSKKKARTCR